MKIRLGVVSVEDCMNIVKEVGAEYSEFSIRYFTYRDRKETVSIIEKYEDEVDMWLLPGYLGYLYVKEWGGAKKQVFHIQYRGASVYKTLCELFYNENLKIKDISFDTIPYDDLNRAFEEMNIQHDDMIFTNHFVVDSPADRVFEYHYNLWKAGQTKVAVTCIWMVKNMLQKAGVPVYRILPVRASVRNVFNYMLRTYDLQIIKDAQISVQVFDFDMYTNHEKLYSTDEYYNEEIKLTQKLILYAKKIYGSLKVIGQGRYFIFTTQGMIKESTNNFNTIPEFEEFEIIEKKLIACGIGIGRSAYDAEFNATIALMNAKRYEKGTWMIAFDDKTIIGPLGKKEQISYSYASVNLQEISSKTSIGIATLSKIIGIMRKKHVAVISANELAQDMQIMPRSARRIISELEKSGLAVEVGEENPNPRGRPRKVYRMEFAPK